VSEQDRACSNPFPEETLTSLRERAIAGQLTTFDGLDDVLDFPAGKPRLVEWNRHESSRTMERAILETTGDTGLRNYVITGNSINRGAACRDELSRITNRNGSLGFRGDTPLQQR
jgi:hypothetical protein